MDTYKLKHQSRGGKNRKANLGVVNLWWRELQANLHLQANHQGPLLHISGSSMALSPNWIISQSTQPRTRSEEATEEDPQRGEGKRNTVAWGLLVPRQQQERVSHEMGLSALQKKKKWASLVVRQPGLVIHPTSWTLCVFYFFIFWAWTLLWLRTTWVITNRVVVVLWDRWIGRKEGGEWRRGWCFFFKWNRRGWCYEESPRRRSQRVSEGSVGTCWSPRTEMLPARPALLLLCSSSSSSPTTRQQGSSKWWPRPAAWIPCSLLARCYLTANKLNHTCIKPGTWLTEGISKRWTQ